MPETDSEKRILLVEDDPRLGQLVREYLGQQGLAVAIETRGDTAAERIVREKPDLVILDLMLPGMDGLTVCRTVRSSFGGPILMLTAREGDMDQVAGLEMGADDYVRKPVDPRVLLARIRALFRRAEPPRMTAPKVADLQELVFGILTISPVSRTVCLAGCPVTLTTGEFDLLHILAVRNGSIVDRDTLYRELRGIDYDGLDRSADLTVSRLRRKLGDDPGSPRRIKTVWGKGYLFVPDAWNNP